MVLSRYLLSNICSPVGNAHAVRCGFARDGDGDGGRGHAACRHIADDGGDWAVLHRNADGYDALHFGDILAHPDPGEPQGLPSH
jgi:hypothetical protein